MRQQNQGFARTGTLKKQITLRDPHPQVISSAYAEVVETEEEEAVIRQRRSTYSKKQTTIGEAFIRAEHRDTLKKEIMDHMAENPVEESKVNVAEETHSRI